jgi:hypothetical protein
MGTCFILGFSRGIVVSVIITKLIFGKNLINTLTSYTAEVFIFKVILLFIAFIAAVITQG